MGHRIEGDVAWVSVGADLEAMVDVADLPKVIGLRWNPTDPEGDYPIYATTWIPGGAIRMHRLILGLSEGGPIVDHRDRNGLNNQRYNLRPCTPSQNMANRRANSDPTMWSRFKGVMYQPPLRICSERVPRGRRWVANITKDGREYFLGRFHLEEDAARAYDAMAPRLFGEFALTNASLGLFDVGPSMQQIKALAFGVRTSLTKPSRSSNL